MRFDRRRSYVSEVSHGVGVAPRRHNCSLRALTPHELTEGWWFRRAAQRYPWPVAEDRDVIGYASALHHSAEALDEIQEFVDRDP